MCVCVSLALALSPPLSVCARASLPENGGSEQGSTVRREDEGYGGASGHQTVLQLHVR